MKILNVEAEGIDLNTVHLHLQIEGFQDALKLGQRFHDLKGKEIVVNIDKHREKRSLNANSYERVLEGKIADVLGTSKDEVHNQMLARYGQYLRDTNGNIVFMLIPESVDYVKDPEIHLKPTGKWEDKNGLKYYWYAQMKPSHKLNTKEFATLLDGVISECKELGIEVLSPDEIHHMEEVYKQEVDGA